MASKLSCNKWMSPGKPFGPPRAPTKSCAKPDENAKTGNARAGDAQHAKARPNEDPTDEPFDPLDPASRHAAQLGPSWHLTNPNGASSNPNVIVEPVAVTAQTHEIAPSARVSMEELLPQLVRRIAWAGDRRKGTVQLELGAGRHSGTTITVHAEDGRVRVELHGADTEDLKQRIDDRLRRRGIAVESVT